MREEKTECDAKKIALKKKNLKSSCFLSNGVLVTYSDYNAQVLPSAVFFATYIRSSKCSQSNTQLYIVLPPDGISMLILFSHSFYLCFILLDLQCF